MRTGTPTRRRFTITAACATLALVVAAPAAGQPRYGPSLRFETLTTPHFVIHFHQGEENLARRLALVAEDVHAALAVQLQARPRDRTHVILVDQHDLANGWATILPVNTIEIDAAWPRSGDLLGNTGDWLRLVFTHEYTHILQMDVSRGFARALGAVFGRSPLAFPNLALPGWLTEGLPTYEESRLTGRGRLRSGNFRAIVDEPLRAGRALPIDRAGGGLTYWPMGIAPYAWGGYFVQYLADRFGEQRLAALTNETAGRFYFMSPPAFRRVFGEGLSTLWREFQRSRADAAVEGSDVAAAGLSRLTSHGYLVTGPRVIGDEVLYSTIDAHGFPALRSVPLDGRTPGRRLADRYLGDGLGAAGGLVWFDQVEIEDAVALRSDLYVLERRSGTVTRVTRGGRYLDVDVSPDGRALAAVALRDGRRRLAVLDVFGDLVDPARISVVERSIVGEDAAEYSAPRWSPDGRTVAAARAWLGGRSDIAVIDAATGRSRSVASSADGRNTSPCWTSDGRTILFASDRAGGALNLFAVDVPAASSPEPGSQPPVYQVTDIVSGAAEPALTPDGKTIVFVGYTADGYDLFSVPVDRAAWSPWTDFASSQQPASAPRHGDVDATQPVPYSPWGTLVPRYWMPDAAVERAQVKAGLLTSGTDVLGRHAWSAAALWRWPRAAGGGFESHPDWRATYTYDRWRPTFFFRASDETDVYETATGEDGADPVTRVRDREALAGVSLSFRSVRRAQAVQARFVWQHQAVTTRAGREGEGSRHALRTAWSFGSARMYAASIGPEHGISASVTSEHVRKAFGASGNADALTVQARRYLRLGPPHATLALRAGIGAAFGDRGVRRRFFLGSAGPAPGLVDFGGDALNLLRGFEDSVRAGSRIATASLEYRLPIARIERGLGAWPFFARTLHAAAFLDAGAAWDGRLDARAVRRAWGAEISLDLVLGFAAPVTFTAGVARPHDPARVVRGTAAYVRIGRSF